MFLDSPCHTVNLVPLLNLSLATVCTVGMVEVGRAVSVLDMWRSKDAAFPGYPRLD